MILDKKYWFTIEPYVYAIFTDSSVLLYNTLDGNTIKTNKKAILKLLSEIYLDNNCGVVMVNQEQVDQSEINAFIQELRKKYMGDIIDVSLSSQKPVQMLPKLSLYESHKNMDEEATYYGIKPSYLMDVNICIIDNNEEIKLPVFERILEQTSDYILSILQLSGANLWNHSSFKDIVKLIEKSSKKVVFCSNYKEIKDEKYLLFLFNSKKLNLKIVVDFPFDICKFNLLIDFFKDKIDTFEFIFQIKSIEDYQQTEEIVMNKQIKNYTFAPLYTQDNLNFFQQSVYLDEESILSTVVPMREIFMHQTLNTNDFGKINIMPNGDVYANTHFSKLGNIKDDYLYDIIGKEMNEGQSWLRIRNQSPCNNCIYQWLCPSPSDYELDIGKTNLCHVKP
jgi:pseudo-rSAM protein